MIALLHLPTGLHLPRSVSTAMQTQCRSTACLEVGSLSPAPVQGDSIHVCLVGLAADVIVLPQSHSDVVTRATVGLLSMLGGNPFPHGNDFRMVGMRRYARNRDIDLKATARHLPAGGGGAPLDLFEMGRRWLVLGWSAVSRCAVD